MTKGIVLTALLATIILSACKKTSAPLYYYEGYEYGTRYTSTPADSFSFIDSAQTEHTSFLGDTIDHGADSHFYINSSYHQKLYKNFEVFRYKR